jgi:hypothetical protein
MSRPGATYEFWGYDAESLIEGRIKRVLLYRGQTRQRPEARRDQHLHGGMGVPAKPWASLVTEWRVTWSRKHVSQMWLNTREALGIAWKSPQYNINFNKMNPRRVTPWEAKRLQRIIAAHGGVEVLVMEAKKRDGVVFGCRLNPDGTWSAYGSRAEEVGRRWKSSGSRILSRQG